MRTIAMIGAFPPPMHGMAAVNLAMKDFFVSNGKSPEIFDLSAISLGKDLHVRLIRIARVLRQLFAYFNFLRAHRNSSVYLSISGGYGQFLEIPFILLSRFWNARIFLHHHSFLYIYNARLLTHLLIYCAGKDAIHIALCNDMAQKLKSSYPLTRRIEILSNSALISLAGGGSRIRKSVTTLGFLGNIEADKGIFEFLDVLSRLQNEGDDIGAIIAGPFRDKTTETLVMNRILNLRGVQYVGPKYGAEKNSFFDSIDVLLYPTKNDAEPLIVLEAMTHGVPVIARSRGCIDEMVTESAGMVVDFNEDYVAVAVIKLRIWREYSGELMRQSQGAIERYRNMQHTSVESLRRLFSIMLTD